MEIAESLRVERAPAPIRSRVLDNLRQAILERKLAPGQRLIERELVELTGVSRTSIREALRELAAEGLVTTIPNKGTVVATVTAEEARQLYQVRSALEGLAGRLFVENATNAQRRALVNALRAVERAAPKGSPAMLAAKDKFYDVLFEGGGNEALRSMAESLHARVNLLRSLSLSLPGRSAESLAELAEIVAAVQAGDADAAAKACSHHVEAAGMAGFSALTEETAG
ncbi:MAG TPA: GntR family transcriptional regulator [Trebonia sp.]|nr:GntR family transcriptional regulator [Trebonia sp.]